MFIVFVTALAGCNVEVVKVEPAKVGHIENAQPTAAPRLLCLRLDQARQAASQLTRQQLQGINNVPLRDLPQGCTRSRPRGDAISRFAGSVLDRDQQWHMAVIELLAPEQPGSLFQPTIFAYTIDPSNARLNRNHR